MHVNSVMLFFVLCEFNLLMALVYLPRMEQEGITKLIARKLYLRSTLEFNTAGRFWRSKNYPETIAKRQETRGLTRQRLSAESHVAWTIQICEIRQWGLIGNTRRNGYTNETDQSDRFYSVFCFLLRVDVSDSSANFVDIVFGAKPETL